MISLAVRWGNRSTATPSVLYPQYIRLEMIEYWKEKFSDYPKVIENLNNIK